MSWLLVLLLREMSTSRGAFVSKSPLDSLFRSFGSSLRHFSVLLILFNSFYIPLTRNLKMENKMIHSSPHLARHSPSHKKSKSVSLFRGIRTQPTFGEVYDEKPQEFELQQAEAEEFKELRKLSLEKSDKGGADSAAVGEEERNHEEYMQLLLEKWKSRKDRSLIRKKLVNVLIIYSGGTIGM